MFFHHDNNVAPHQHHHHQEQEQHPQHHHQQVWMPISTTLVEDDRRNSHSIGAAPNNQMEFLAPVSAFRLPFYMPSSSHNDRVEAPRLAFGDFDESVSDVVGSSRRTSRTASPNKKQIQVSEDEISQNDVLCGRGAGANTHGGNIVFRSLVSDLHHAYLKAKSLDKVNIAKGIIGKITEQGGRFLKRQEHGVDGKSGFWYDIGFKAAREKTCQALRERAPSTFGVPNQAGASRSILPNIIPDLTATGHAVAHGTVKVSDRDVLLGRGGVTNSHIGNKKYRALVHGRQREYCLAKKLKKSGIAQQITGEIFNEGGRFLTEKNGEWVAISKDKAREKTSQALREKAPELRRIYEVAHELVAKKAAEKRYAQQQCSQQLAHLFDSNGYMSKGKFYIAE